MNRSLRLVAGTEARLQGSSYEDLVEDLRGIVWNAFIREGRTLEDIAVAANLHTTTVERFAWGDTKRPAARTVIQLILAVGFRLPLIEAAAPRQPNEVDLRWMHSLIKNR